MPEGTFYDGLDDFAGPGGWDEGARMVGLKTIGVEWDESACQTAVANGHARIHADVASHSHEGLNVGGLYIASPPCTMFTTMGHGAGRATATRLGAGVAAILGGDDPEAVIAAATEALIPAHRAAQGSAPSHSLSHSDLDVAAEIDAATSALILQPARRIAQLKPDFVALEQVPGAAVVWGAYAHVLRAMGWSATYGILNAADYGVPQSRRRAILVASRHGAARLPAPTHAEHADDLFGGLAPWVSIRDAVGWGLDVPSPTIAPGHNLTADYSLQRKMAELAREADRPAVTMPVSERGILQSFPPDYVWRGRVEEQQRQVGNAVPPLLAAHVLAALLGLPVPISQKEAARA